MTLIAPHIAAFLRQRLSVERQASANTCDSYADAFRLLFAYASNCLKIPPSQLQLEHIDAALIMNFLNHLESARKNSAAFQKHSARGHQVIHAVHGVSCAVCSRTDSLHSVDSHKEDGLASRATSDGEGNAIDLGCSRPGTSYGYS